MGWSKEDHWHLKGMLDLHRKYGPSPKNCYVGDFVGDQCVKCNNVTPIKACPNCSRPYYGLGYSPEGHLGLFCAQCNKGITTLTCSCGCENPIDEGTLAIKDGVRSSENSKVTVHEDGSVTREDDSSWIGCIVFLVIAAVIGIIVAIKNC